MKKISAIVCVYNREDVLSDCLDALVSQSLPEDYLEVIVVDNASTDKSPEIAASYSKKYRFLRVVREEQQGLAAARNRGLNEAASTIAAFTDDDAIPASDWLERLLHRFESLGEKTVAVGGELDPIWSQPKPDWLTGDQLLHSLSVCLQWSEFARHLAPSEWLCEANSAYRIEPLIQRGGFPEELGRIGSNLLSGENAINEILRRDGYRFFYDPEIRVDHQIPLQRMNKEWFRKRFFWQGVTTFHVNNYLRDKGCEVPPTAVVKLPMDEHSWASSLGNLEGSNFQEVLQHVYGIGYALAASRMLTGR